MPYVYHIVEQREHAERVGPGGADERSVPEAFVDRLPHVPEQCGGEQRGGSAGHAERLAAAGEAFVAPADELPGEHAQHGRHDGREGAQDAFRIETVEIEVRGHDPAVDIARDIAFEGERAGSGGVGRADEVQHEAVCGENAGREDDARAEAEAHVEQRGEHPRQSDASQHARQPQRGEVEPEKSVIDQSQQDER